MCKSPNGKSFQKNGNLSKAAQCAAKKKRKGKRTKKLHGSFKQIE
jgi:hypothetical protein